MRKAEFQNGTERDERGERRVELEGSARVGHAERVRHNYNGTRSRRGGKREEETEGSRKRGAIGNCRSEGRKGRE
jgi:hypothetical protein